MTGTPKVKFLWWMTTFIAVILTVPVLIASNIIPLWSAVPALAVYLIWIHCSDKMVDKGWFR
jgi:hypothetical protein